MTLRSRASPKAWLPMKVMPETPVFGPSVITKTRFTRLFGSSIVCGVTDAWKRAGAAIELEDPRDVVLHLGAGEDAARLPTGRRRRAARP